MKKMKVKGASAKQKTSAPKKKSFPKSKGSAAKPKDSDIEVLQKELKKKLASKSFEDFVNEDLDSEDEGSLGSFEDLGGSDDEDAVFTGDDSEGEVPQKKQPKTKLKGKKANVKVDSEDSQEDEKPRTAPAKKKQQNKKEKSGVDPLEFDSSDSEDEEVHTLPDRLEVASDESDFEDTEDGLPSRSASILSISQVDQWQIELENDKTTRTISQIIGALNSALATLHNEDTKSEIRVEGSSAFNAIVRLCLLKMLPAFKRQLKIAPQEKRLEPARSKNWSKVKGVVRQYLLSVVKLLNGVHSENLLSVVLKHIHQAIPFFACVPKAAKLLLKKVLVLWSSGEESVRVLAFMCLLKMCTVSSEEYLELVMKGMYLAFVKNTKFTSPNTWPGINFMRRSLVEVYALDDRLAYRHGFLYIRQLAIHLRNAMTLKKKDSLQVVYNWQFVHSLHFWAAVVGVLNSSQNARQLIYPLTQIAIGTINLMPTAKYYPLRFHCAKILGQLSSQTKTFIPVLPFYMDVLQNHNFNRKLDSKATFKSLDLSSVLKVSTSQLKEGSYRDAIIDHIHDGIVEYVATCCHMISFPETVFPTVMQIRAFLKKCNIPSCTKKMKSLMDRLIENSKFVEDKRKAVTFGISDTQAIDAWETQLRLAGTPFSKFYVAWRKEHDRQAIARASRSDGVSFDEIPVMKKKKDKTADVSKEEEEFEGLFPSGDEESDDEERFLPKEERGKPKKRPIEETNDKPPTKVAPKKQKKNVEKSTPKKEKKTYEEADGEDEVRDLHLSDLESDEERENMFDESDIDGSDASDDNDE